jgi:hypothetical protein
MPIHEFISGRPFDPETVEIMNTAFLKGCEDLGGSRRDAGVTALKIPLAPLSSAGMTLLTRGSE